MAIVLFHGASAFRFVQFIIVRTRTCVDLFVSISVRTCTNKDLSWLFLCSPQAIT